jgi:hypothetical protein
MKVVNLNNLLLGGENTVHGVLSELLNKLVANNGKSNRRLVGETGALAGKSANLHLEFSNAGSELINGSLVLNTLISGKITSLFLGHLLTINLSGLSVSKLTGLKKSLGVLVRVKLGLKLADHTIDKSVKVKLINVPAHTGGRNRNTDGLAGLLTLTSGARLSGDNLGGRGESSGFIGGGSRSGLSRGSGGSNSLRLDGTGSTLGLGRHD